MKNSLPILVMLVVLVALPATAAWSQNNGYEQCMENCLEPAMESGDEDVINATVTKCLDQCESEALGQSNLGSASTGMSSNSRGRCLQVCFDAHRECMRYVRNFKRCHYQFQVCSKHCNP